MYVIIHIKQLMDVKHLNGLQTEGDECSSSKAVSPFMCSRSHYQRGCIMLINRISTEAVMWLV